MAMVRDLRVLLAKPDVLFAAHLRAPPSPRRLFAELVAPLAAIRSLAELSSSLLVDEPFVGVVVGVSSFVLQIGAWLALTRLLPALAHQLRLELNHTQARLLATYASVPLWLAGVLYAVPEAPAATHQLSRVAVFLLALLGASIVHRGLRALGWDTPARSALTFGTGFTYTAIYGLLTFVLGVAASVILYLSGRS